jgi:hypothetical protein
MARTSSSVFDTILPPRKPHAKAQPHLRGHGIGIPDIAVKLEAPSALRFHTTTYLCSRATRCGTDLMDTLKKSVRGGKTDEEPQAKKRRGKKAG